jgi:excisionase family DNA binding protein
MAMAEAEAGEEVKEVLTAEELARYLGFNRNWIYRQAEAGEIPGVKLGKSWRFKRSVIDRWLEERILPKPKAGGEVRVEAKVKAKIEAGIKAEVKAKAEEEELPPEATLLLERVFKVIKSHPKGVTLPKIGEELGLDWRRLTYFVNRLVEEGRVRRSGPPGRMYFPVE